MQTKANNSVLTSVEKYELCKGRMLRRFISVFNRTSNSKKAYDEAKGVIDSFVTKGVITNTRQISGLHGELVYFYRSFQEHDLTAEMAIGYKADYRGKILDRPAAIDVTTNPFFKDKKERFEQIRGTLLNGWDYYVGVVNIKKVESELFPLLLPICKDDNVGFFVLVYDDLGPSGQNLYGENSDLQQIIKYNPKCGGDESEAVEGVVSTYNYILEKPETAIHQISENRTMDLDKITPEIEGKIKNDIDRYFDDIVSFFRKISGLTISAVVDTATEVIGYKENIVDVTKQFWVHPHRYIRKNIGKQGEIMDYDIAAYVHDYL